MAIVKVFDSNGVKTVEPLGNVTEQDYDVIEDEYECEPTSEPEDEH